MGSTPIPSAKIRNSNFRQKYGRREAPSVLHSPHKILILQGFAPPPVGQKKRRSEREQNQNHSHTPHRLLPSSPPRRSSDLKNMGGARRRLFCIPPTKP